MTDVLAVDGNSLAHRAYHAMADEPHDGAWLLGGVVRMLATAWAFGPFDGIVVALDGADNQRKLLEPRYKAHRDETPPDLDRQIDLLEAHLPACGFLVARRRGVEADDLLAAAADACTSRGWTCTVLSSDRDLLALVGPSVTLVRISGSMGNLQAYDPARVEAEYGVRPDQYTDLAAMRGDPSDGLDGIGGVGTKTAARLLRRYGDVPGIYAALPYLPPRLEAALRAGRDNVERNLMLMAPLPGLDVDVAAAVAAGVDEACVVTALEAVEEYHAAGAFRAALRRPSPPPVPPPPDEWSVPIADPVGTALPERTHGTGRERIVTGEQVALF